MWEKYRKETRLEKPNGSIMTKISRTNKYKQIKVPN